MQQVVFIGWLAALAATATNAQSAQQRAEPPMWLLGLDASGYHKTDSNGPMGLGVSVAAQRELNSMLGLRGTLSAMDTWDVSNITFCRPLPNDECRPADIFPKRVWSLTASLVSRMYPRDFLFVMIGAGIALPNGAQNDRLSTVDTSTGPRLTGHAGLELAFGRSDNMPRIRIVRTRYLGGLYSMKGHTTVAFVLRLL